MGRKVCISYFSLLLFIFNGLILSGQGTSVYQDPGASFKAALELYEKEKYGSAQKAFKELAEKLPDESSLLKIDAEYYDAACAANLLHSDAEFRLYRFIENYPENANSQLAYFQLGKLQYKNGKYSDALASFREVNIFLLTEDEKDEYFFKSGFSYYKKKEYARAQTEFRKLVDGDGRYKNDAIFYYAQIAYLEEDYGTALEYFNKIKDDRAFRKDVALYLVHINHQHGDYDATIRDGIFFYEMASNNDKIDLSLLIGDAFYKKDNYEEAIKYLEFYNRASGREKSREALYELAYSYFKTGNYKDAINYFQDVTGEKDSLSQNAYYHLGYSYLKTDQKQFASSAFSSAHGLDFNEDITEDALFNYAKLSMEVSKEPYNSAIKNLEQYIRDYPASPRVNEAYQYLASLYMSTNNYKQALASIENIKSRNRELDLAYQKILYYRGVELFNQEEYNDAINMFKRSGEFNYDNEIIMNSNFWIGEAFYRQKNYWGANKYYNLFLSIPGSGNNILYPSALYNLGYTYFERNNYNEAGIQFEKFLRIKNTNNTKMTGDALIRLGDSYLIRKNYTEAIRRYDEAIRLDKVDVDYALQQKAMALGALGRFNDKIRTLKQLISSYPASPLADDAKYEIANTYLINNNGGEALAYFDKVVREHPNSNYAARSMLKSGLVFYNENNNEQAIRVLREVANKYPGTPESRQALASLRNIYVDLNRVSEYYDFAKNLSFADISVSEQDSLTYMAAENIYMENRCKDAIPAFQSYLSKFEKGYFASNANYYLAECLLKENRQDEALFAFKKVIELPRSRFTVNSLLKVSEMEFRRKNYGPALDVYTQLHEYAESKEHLLLAIEGQMKCNYKLNRYEAAINHASELLKTETVSNDLINEAHLILARSYLNLEDLNAAQREYTITEKLTDTETGAEAKYYLAFLAHKMGKNNEAENHVFELADKYAAYDYWVALSYILLADIYVEMDNSFQAKQTLQSIIENYEGEELRNIAQEKLDNILEMEGK